MNDTLQTMKTLRQSRKFDGQPVEADDLQTILEIARWTGSSRNSQPWQVIVVEDREQMKRLAHVRELNKWMEHAACAIAIVMPEGSTVATQYDEGRMSERIMLAADVLGYGSGTAWYTTDDEIAAAKDILQVPEQASLRSMVVIGRVSDDPAERGRGSGGRKPLAEIVSYNRYGERER
jgi:nitroreductase